MFLVERLALGAKASDVANAVRRIMDDVRMIVLCKFIVCAVNRRLVADVRLVAVVACFRYC
jgi:hypothetical protein